MTAHKPFTKNELLALRMVADPVLPSTWEAGRLSNGQWAVATRHDGTFIARAMTEEDAVFIAAFDPVTICRLLDEIRALREALRPFASLGSTIPAFMSDLDVQLHRIKCGDLRRAVRLIGMEG